MPDADNEQPGEDPETATDRFGLPFMTSEQEVAVSMVLLFAGVLMIGSTLYSLRGHFDMGAAWLGLVMVSTAYLFVLESVHELEEEDHWLSRKLRKNE
jgi:hypothetical protein